MTRGPITDRQDHRIDWTAASPRGASARCQRPTYMQIDEGIYKGISPDERLRAAVEPYEDSAGALTDSLLASSP